MIVRSILADAWNALIDHLRRNRIRDVVTLEGGDWRHPWQISPQWNAEREWWEAAIEPGFVNGVDATVQLDAQQASEATLSRLENPTGPVDAWLTESPRLALTSWRSIGADSSPTGSSEGEDGNVNFTFEPVPKFFAALGVGQPPKIGSGDGDGIIQSVSGTGEDQAKVRLLRALDVVLYQDRPATASQFTQSEGTDGVIFQYDVTVVSAPDARERAYLRTTSKYQPLPPPADALARLMGDWSDTPRDELWLATVYLVSPEGAAPGSEVDGTWQPYVKHRVFWNLLHATNRLEPRSSQNLTLNTGLAAGVGDRINQFLLSQVNDGNSAISQFLGRNTIEGRFWSA